MTLDQLSRTDLLKVLNYLKKYLLIEYNAKNSCEAIRCKIIKNNESLSDSRKIRIAIFGFVVLLTLPPFVFSCIMLISTFLNLENTSFDLFENALYVFVIFIVLSINTIIFLFLKSKQDKDKNRIAKFNAGLLPYISEYKAIINQSQIKYQNLYRTYNIHSSLQNLSVIEYVLSDLSSNSRLSLYTSVNNYYQNQHNEAMRQEAVKQRAVMESIRKENQYFHEDMVYHLSQIKNELHTQTEIQSDIAWSYLH